MLKTHLLVELRREVVARSLDPAKVTGTVIIVPAMNYPAFRAGTRTSPIDKGNLNRTFPGRPDGTVTEKIADYFQRYLLPKTDIVLDFHSGGRTLEQIAQWVETENLNPQPRSGRQEYLENLVNRFV